MWAQLCVHGCVWGVYECVCFYVCEHMYMHVFVIVCARAHAMVRMCLVYIFVDLCEVNRV